jgi:chemotaxis methyl-accepting protein methylase
MHLIQYRKVPSSIIKETDRNAAPFQLSDTGEINCNIGMSCAVAFHHAESGLGGLLMVSASATDFGSVAQKRIDDALARLQARGIRLSSLDCVLFGGAERQLWQIDRIEKMLNRAGVTTRRLPDIGGDQTRKANLTPRTGKLLVAHGNTSRVQLNPARSSLSADEGGRHFSESMVDGVVANATRFFRLKTTLVGLREMVFPEFVQLYKSRPFTFWSAACSSGEEVYSFGMVLSRLHEKEKCCFPIQLFASDINSDRLQKARKGIYNIPHEDIDAYGDYFRRYGDLDGQRFTVGRDLRAKVKFGLYDIRKAPRKHRFQMIVCANVFQYYNNEARKHFFLNFLSALERPGYIYANNLPREVIEETGGEYFPRYRLIRYE